MIRTIIADDHELIREGFKKLLDRQDDITLVAEARTGGEIFDCLRECACDVLVLDISLPDKSGLDVLKELRNLYPHLRCLVLSMHPEERYATRALKNGAAGYITKASADQELIKAIRKIAQGGRYISEALAEELASAFSAERESETHEKLSDREYQIFLLIGKGKTIQEIADNLALSINTVNTYRRRIFEKTALRSNAEIIQYVIQHNLIE
jgi:DNA-binding NarL/FixJ family response regulator